jgi:hypothetical protein
MRLQLGIKFGPKFGIYFGVNFGRNFDEMKGFHLPDTMYFAFAPTKLLPSGDTDEICRICFEWCVANSICVNRYMDLQGKWLTRNPETLPTAEQDPVDIVPICDGCYNKHRVETLDEIDILGQKFAIHCQNRVND